MSLMTTRLINLFQMICIRLFSVYKQPTLRKSSCFFLSEIASEFHKQQVTFIYIAMLTIRIVSLQ